MLAALGENVADPPELLVATIACTTRMGRVMQTADGLFRVGRDALWSVKGILACILLAAIGFGALQPIDFQEGGTSAFLSNVGFGAVMGAIAPWLWIPGAVLALTMGMFAIFGAILSVAMAIDMLRWVVRAMRSIIARVVRKQLRLHIDMPTGSPPCFAELFASASPSGRHSPVPSARRPESLAERGTATSTTRSSGSSTSDYPTARSSRCRATPSSRSRCQRVARRHTPHRSFARFSMTALWARREAPCWRRPPSPMVTRSRWKARSRRTFDRSRAIATASSCRSGAAPRTHHSKFVARLPTAQRADARPPSQPDRPHGARRPATADAAGLATVMASESVDA